MAKDTKKNKVKKEKNEKKYFFKDFKAELKKVTWPTAKQLANKTVAVIAIVIIIAAIVFALDLAFDKGYEFLINKTYSAINKNDKSNTIDNGNEVEDAVQVEEVTDNGEVVTTENTESAENTETDNSQIEVTAE